jgi:hypothetical protein
MSRPRRSPDSEPDPEVSQLLFFIDTAYDRLSWHGPNLRGSLRGVTPDRAAWRPAPGRHNIWELAVHAAYWKYVAWRRLTGAKRGSFALGGSNFLERPATAGAALGRPTLTAAWRRDLDALHATHLSLRRAVEATDPETLSKVLPGSGKVTRRALIAGIAAHDLYHAGQIQLLKRLGLD